MKNTGSGALLGPLPRASRLNTEKYPAFPRIQPQCGKKRTKKTPNTNTFNTVYIGVPRNLSNISDRAFSKISYWLLAVNHIETPVLESLFAKVTGLQLTTLLKKRLQDSCFSVNFGKFLIAAF